MNPDMDAIYILTPQPHIVDCLMADFERRRYRRTYIVWTSLLEAPLRRRIDQSRQAQEQLADFQTLSIDYFPRESHLITFRDPSSFPILYHPSCDVLVAQHLQTLAQKVGSPRSKTNGGLIIIDYWPLRHFRRIPQSSISQSQELQLRSKRNV